MMSRLFSLCMACVVWTLLLTTGHAADADKELHRSIQAAVGELVGDQKHGVWTRRDSDGQLRWRGVYEHGQLHGPLKAFHPNGKPRFEFAMHHGEPPAQFIYQDRMRSVPIALRWPRSRADTIDMLARFYPDLSIVSQMADEDHAEPPYRAGSTTVRAQRRALQVVQCYRYLSGLDWDDLQLDSAWTERCQHAAVLLNRLDQVTHHPARPADMDQAFFEPAQLAARQSNLHHGASTMSHAVYHFMAELEAVNWQHCGHRRFVLNPTMQRTAFGFSGDMTVMYAHDLSRSHPTAYQFFTYPGEGCVPAHLFSNNEPWSVYFNRKKFQLPSDDQIDVRVTELDEGFHSLKDWKIDFTYMDDDPMWPTPAVNFRPNIKGPLVGRQFLVRISGLRSGRRVREIGWVVQFADLEQAIKARRAQLQQAHE